MFRAINPQNSLLPWTTWTVSTCCGIYRSISHQLAGLDTLMVPDASIPVSMIPRYIQVLVSMTSRTTYQGHYSWSINEKENRVSVMTRYQHPSINHTQKPRIKTKNVGICARYWSSARKLLASFNTSWSTSVSFVGSVPSNGIIAHSLGVVPDNFHNHPLKFGFKKNLYRCSSTTPYTYNQQFVQVAMFRVRLGALVFGRFNGLHIMQAGCVFFTQANGESEPLYQRLTEDSRRLLLFFSRGKHL